MACSCCHGRPALRPAEGPHSSRPAPSSALLCSPTWWGWLHNTHISLHFLSCLVNWSTVWTFVNLTCSCTYRQIVENSRFMFAGFHETLSLTQVDLYFILFYFFFISVLYVYRKSQLLVYWFFFSSHWCLIFMVIYMLPSFGICLAHTHTRCQQSAGVLHAAASHFSAGKMALAYNWAVCTVQRHILEGGATWWENREKGLWYSSSECTALNQTNKHTDGQWLVLAQSVTAKQSTQIGRCWFIIFVAAT